MHHHLLDGGGDVVDVVGDAGQQVAAGVSIEVAQRQPADLHVNVAAQLLHRVRGDPGHDVRLAPTEYRGQQVDHHHERQQVPQSREIDANPGRERHSGQHVRNLVLALGAQSRLGLLLGDARGQLGAYRALEHQGRGIAQQLRANHGETHARAGEQQHGDEPAPEDGKAVHQAPGGALEIGRFLHRDGKPGHRAALTRPAAGQGTTCGGAHPTSSGCSCEETISA